MMDTSTPSSSRSWWVVAQDPALRDPDTGEIITTQLELPAERLDEGPRGYRFTVIDYDATQATMYRPWRDDLGDAAPSRKTILGDPRFHAQNVHALASLTLARFERALGRRIPWGFKGQQLKIAPHAFQEANAFYSREHQALLFGYFPSRQRGRWIYTCLAHDVIVHETTHAIIDGLRTRYLDPSHPDQAAFHEGFADVVALLSVYAMPDVTRTLLLASDVVVDGMIARKHLTAAALRETQLVGLADEIGQELSGVRGQALRRSATLTPVELAAQADQFSEPHRRGELLVAAMLDAFLAALAFRVTQLGDGKSALRCGQVIEEAAAAAETLLTLAIRAIDYAPPVDVRLHDFLSALITSDTEIRPDDSRYQYRDRLVAAFRKFQVEGDAVAWRPAPDLALSYAGANAESLTRSPEEVHRFLWANREALEIPEDAYTHVFSVEPCTIIQADGLAVRQTVCQYKQTIHLRAGELARHGLRRPVELAPEAWMKLNGGGVLIFDGFGRLRYHIQQRVFGRSQQERLEAMSTWSTEFTFRPLEQTSAFAALHTARGQSGLP